jgi:hypothetical protein
VPPSPGFRLPGKQRRQRALDPPRVGWGRPRPWKHGRQAPQRRQRRAGSHTVRDFLRMPRLGRAHAGAFNAVYAWCTGKHMLVVLVLKPINRGEVRVRMAALP